MGKFEKDKMRFKEFLNENTSDFLTTKESIEDFLDDNSIMNYTINDDLTVDVYEDVLIDTLDYDHGHFPIQFGEVNGDFDARGLHLVFLDGAPKEVGGNFDVANNRLTSLKHSPNEVAGDFSISSNELISLKYSPNEVGGDYIASHNNLKNIDGISKRIDGDLYLSNNKFNVQDLDISNIKLNGNLYIPD